MFLVYFFINCLSALYVLKSLVRLIKSVNKFKGLPFLTKSQSDIMTFFKSDINSFFPFFDLGFIYFFL